jgi:hypothetical protein
MVYAITTVCVPWQLEHNYLKISPTKQIQTKFCEEKTKILLEKISGIFQIFTWNLQN